MRKKTLAGLLFWTAFTAYMLDCSRTLSKDYIPKTEYGYMEQSYSKEPLYFENYTMGKEVKKKDER